MWSSEDTNALSSPERTAITAVQSAGIDAALTALKSAIATANASTKAAGVSDRIFADIVRRYCVRSGVDINLW